jgi:hypothetical protein
MASAVSNAWNEQYTGNSHQLLLQNINRMLRNKPYSNSVAILQSSGSGKSRMVREQSNLVFTLPFNLRAHSDNKSLVFFICIGGIFLPSEIGMAYPPPDTEIRNQLDWQAPILHEGQVRYLHLLGCIFGIVSDELDMLYKEKNEPSYTSLAENWRKHLEKDGNRTRMYGKAVIKSSADDSVITLSMIRIHYSRFLPE